MSWIAFLIIGLIAGWLAETLMKGRGAGLLVNLIVGIIGAYVGGIVFGLLGLHAGGFIGSLVTATVGAVVLLALPGNSKKGLRSVSTEHWPRMGSGSLAPFFEGPVSASVHREDTFCSSSLGNPFF